MRWFYELAWLWKGLGISLLAAAACMVCVWLVCRAAGKRLRTGIAVLAAAAGFAAAVVVILLLAQEKRGKRHFELWEKRHLNPFFMARLRKQWSGGKL